MKRPIKQLCVFFAVLVMISITACSTPSKSNGSNSAQTAPAAEQDAAPTEAAEAPVVLNTGTVPEALPDVPAEVIPAENEADPAEQTEAASVPESTEPKTDLLVIYFSRTGEQYTVGVIDKGNTAIAAEMIAEQTGADLFEVLPVDDHYPMTYNALTDVAKQEQNAKARPEYAGELPDLARYDTIFIGAPVWWGDWPMIMYTVFENNDFSGKKLVPFSTHEGSGLSGFDRKLAAACPNSTILTGLAVRGNDCQNRQDSVRSAVNSWITDLGLN